MQSKQIACAGIHLEQTIRMLQHSGEHHYVHVGRREGAVRAVRLVHHAQNDGTSATGAGRADDLSAR